MEWKEDWSAAVLEHPGAPVSWGCEKTRGLCVYLRAWSNSCKVAVLVRIPGRASREWVVSVVHASWAG